MHSIVLFKGYTRARVSVPFAVILRVRVSCAREAQVYCPNINCVSEVPGLEVRSRPQMRLAGVQVGMRSQPLSELTFTGNGTGMWH